MKKELISRQLVRYLEDRGIEHVFGLCGHTNIAVLAEIAKSKVKFVNVRHEQIAAHMADGYARAKKQTAVLLTLMPAPLDIVLPDALPAHY